VTYLVGTPQYAAVTAATRTVTAGELNTTFYVTPNASNTTITLPTAGAVGHTVRFIFDTATAVGRYCDVVITSAATFKTPFSAAAKKMRFWKPCNVTFFDNGSEWTAMSGSCFRLQPWFIGETEGSLGHGLLDVVPFGHRTGCGVRGLLGRCNFVQRQMQGSFDGETIRNGDFEVEQNLSGGVPLWFGTTIKRNSQTDEGLMSTDSDVLMPGGSLAAAKQFQVINFNTGGNWQAATGWDRFFVGAYQHSGGDQYRSYWYRSPSNYKINAKYYTSSGNDSGFNSAVLSDDTDYTLLNGFDEAGAYGSLNGAALAASSDNGTFAGTTTSYGDNPTSIFTGKEVAPGGGTPLCTFKYNSIFFYVGRDRWTSDEVADFYARRTGSDGKVLL